MTSEAFGDVVCIYARDNAQAYKHARRITHPYLYMYVFFTVPTRYPSLPIYEC